MLALSLSLHLGFRLPLSLFHTTTAPIIRHRRSSLTPDPPSPSLVPHCRSSSLTAAAASPSLSLTNDVDGCSPLTATPPSPAIFPHRRFQRQCSYCSAPVPFESTEYAFCRGVNCSDGVSQRHKLFRCAASMQISRSLLNLQG
ncbi:unnamed protein product [Camellia sinensis]